MSQKDKDTHCEARSHCISRKQYSILCVDCDKWFHNKCNELSDAPVKYFDSELKKTVDDRWKCLSCGTLSHHLKPDANRFLYLIREVTQNLLFRN